MQIAPKWSVILTSTRLSTPTWGNVLGAMWRITNTQLVWGGKILYDQVLYESMMRRWIHCDRVGDKGCSALPQYAQLPIKGNTLPPYHRDDITFYHFTDYTQWKVILTRGLWARDLAHPHEWTFFYKNNVENSTHARTHSLINQLDAVETYSSNNILFE